MIIKASERGGWSDLARHLTNEHDNDVVEVDHLEGFISGDIAGAFQEIYASSRSTACVNYLVSVSLSPPAEAELGKDAFRDAAQKTMKRLGLCGQPYALIFHEKHGRRHAHLVISRIDRETVKAINLSFFKDKLCDLSRELFLQHGLELPKGHIDRALSSDLNYSLEEHQCAKRSGRSPQTIKHVLKTCWAQSDDLKSFTASAAQVGFRLARGDRRGFVGVDEENNVYSLSRFLDVRPKELRARLGDPSTLPGIEELSSEVQSGEPSPALNNALLQTQLQLKQRHMELRLSHRVARAQLKADYQSQKLKLVAQFQRERTGLRGLWNRVTGETQNLIAARREQIAGIEAEYEETLLELSNAHRAEMRALHAEISEVSHQLESERFAKTAAFVADRFVPLPDPDHALHRALIRKSPRHVIDIISQKREVFSRNDIVRLLAEHIEAPLHLREAIDQILSDSELVCIEGKDTSNPKFSSRDFLKTKTQLEHRVQRMADRTAFGVRENLFRAAIQKQNIELQKTAGANLSDEQIAAIRHVLNRRQFSAVVGLAGAGKSTMLSAANDAWAAQGYRVLGAALSGKAADGLEKASHIKSRTLASWELSWKNKKNTLRPGDILVIDEAGMVPTRQLARFIEHAHKNRAKIVLVGDPEQLQPINAGTPFADILKDTSHARLTEVRRQTADWQKQASIDLANGEIETALKAYEEHGCIIQEGTTKKAIQVLVEDYMADYELNEQDTSCLALAYKKQDVFSINQHIRFARKSAGELTEELLVETPTGPRSFAVSDRIVFTRNDAALGVRNGTLGRVTAIGDNQLTVVPDGSDKHVTINTLRCNSIDHGYATTIHKSQGTTVDRTFLLASAGMDKHLTYVAMTRHRSALKTYTAEAKNSTCLTPTPHFSSIKAERHKDRTAVTTTPVPIEGSARLNSELEFDFEL